MITCPLPSTEEWLRNHHPEMVDCPHQPGRLRISKEACRRRTLAGRRIKIIENDLLLQTGRKGLLVCRKCPIGNELVSDPGKKRNFPRARGKPRRNPPGGKFFHSQNNRARRIRGSREKAGEEG